MGIFDKLMRAIGFEDEEIAKRENNELLKDKKEKKVIVNSKFDLKNIKEENLEIEIKFYNPKSQLEIEEIAKELIKGCNAKVDFNDFPESDKTRALDFLYGVIFTLNGKIEKIDKNIYLLKNKEINEK